MPRLRHIQRAAQQATTVSAAPALSTRLCAQSARQTRYVRGPHLGRDRQLDCSRRRDGASTASSSACCSPPFSLRWPSSFSPSRPVCGRQRRGRARARRPLVARRASAGAEGPRLRAVEAVRLRHKIKTKNKHRASRKSKSVKSPKRESTARLSCVYTTHLSESSQFFQRVHASTNKLPSPCA